MATTQAETITTGVDQLVSHIISAMEFGTLEGRLYTQGNAAFYFDGQKVGDMYSGGVYLNFHGVSYAVVDWEDRDALYEALRKHTS